ncbi:hypothetical protein V2J09_001187 [Rumex salicifolius]
MVSRFDHGWSPIMVNRFDQGSSAGTSPLSLSGAIAANIATPGAIITLSMFSVTLPGPLDEKSATTGAGLELENELTYLDELMYLRICIPASSPTCTNGKAPASKGTLFCISLI